MTSNRYLQIILPHVIAVVAFFVIAAAYYSPVLSGKVLSQSDNVQARGMQAEISKYIEKDGEHILWTNSMFGGMPVYQIHLPTGNNYTLHFNRLFLLNGSISSPLHSMFLMMVMFYILMAALGVDWRLSIIGAIAYGLATNHIVLTEAGHSTKLITMAYLPPTLAGIVLAFRGKYLAGGVLTALFLSLQILANHVQVSYYFFLALFFLGIFEFVKAIRTNQIPRFAMAVGVLVLAGLIGVGANLARLWTTYEYTDETIRGQSELTVAGQYGQNSSTNKEDGGLSKDYIFGWSYGIGESFTILVPDFMGRASGSTVVDKSGQFRDDTESATVMQRKVMPQLQAQGQQGNQVLQDLVRAANPYRGDVQFTSGPIYFGAIICFLFALGLILVKGSMKWWLLTATILMFFLGWGRHFGALNYFLYEHFPMFNKFRAVMMAIGIGQLFVTALAILGLKELIFNKELTQDAKTRALYLAGGIVGGLCALIYLGSLLGFIDFAGPRDAEILTQYPDLQAALYQDRAAMAQADALRSLLFIGLSMGALWLYATARLRWLYAIGIVAVLVLIDFWGVGRRFLGPEDFQTKQATRAAVQPNSVDQQIQNDQDPHFRVMDYIKGSPFQSALPSYFHKSMGGYHAAKLMRFQDLCEHYLFSGNIQANQRIYGMFNTKYFIYPQNNQPTLINNPEALGNAWFVKEYEIVENADAEMAALGTLVPREKAVIDNKFASYMEGLQQDSTITPGDNVTLTSYHPDEMVYKVKASKERLAVFSEMYYPPSKGWNVYINGKKQDPSYIKANYVLRALRVPAGEYELTMRFEPRSYKVGALIALICSLLIIGGVIFYLFRSYRAFDPDEYLESQQAAMPIESEKPVKAAKTTRTEKSRNSRSQKSTKESIKPATQKSNPTAKKVDRSAEAKKDASGRNKRRKPPKRRKK